MPLPGDRRARSRRKLCRIKREPAAGNPAALRRPDLRLSPATRRNVQYRQMTTPAVEFESKQKSFDPDQYRMTIGEHLEDLRRRLILALAGLVIAFIGCLIFGQTVMSAFCKPLIDVLQAYEVNPQIYFTQVSDPFMV